MRALNIRKEKKELYRTVYDTVEPLRDLIKPEELTNGAEKWEDVSNEDLEREIHQSVKMNLSESNYEKLVKELAIHLWLDGMSRVKLEHLVFDTDEEALKHGYWPNGLSVLGAQAKIYDMIEEDMLSLPNVARNQAHCVAKSAVADKLDPRVNEPEYK